MVTFQACLVTDLSWLEQKLWHPHLHGDSYACRTAWLALPGAAVSLPLAKWLAQSHVGSQIAHISKSYLSFPSTFKLVPFYSVCAVPSSFLMHWNTAADLYFSICPVYGTAHFCCKNTVNNLSNVSFIKHLRTPRSDFVQGMKSYSINPLFRAMMENNIIRSHSFSLEIVIGLWIL